MTKNRPQPFGLRRAVYSGHRQHIASAPRGRVTNQCPQGSQVFVSSLVSKLSLVVC